MKRVILSFAVAALLSGCATITSPSSERINVSSTTNKQFRATLDGVPFNVPGSVSVKRDGDEKVILTSQDGCAQATTVNKEIDTIFWGNIIFGGILGSATDYGSGKMWDYDDTVYINCVK